MKLQDAIDPYMVLDGGRVERILARVENGETYAAIVIYKGNEIYELQFRDLFDGVPVWPTVKQLK